MRNNLLDKKKKIQEEQYAYPYHYIPTWEDGMFSQVQYWSWGYRYLGGIKVVLDQLVEISFDSLLDVGCGDGRFLREVEEFYPDVTLLGVDISERAIQLAKAMNSQLHYKLHDVLEESLGSSFDVVTAIEVLEHIRPDNLVSFLEAMADSLKDSGWLILTVPHINKSVSDKHYQHFSSDKLQKHLSPFFSKISLFPFDVRSRLMARLQQLLGGKGEHFIITNERVTNWFFKLYCEHFLYTDNEDKCMRIAAVCQK